MHYIEVEYRQVGHHSSLFLRVFCSVLFYILLEAKLLHVVIVWLKLSKCFIFSNIRVLYELQYDDRN